MKACILFFLISMNFLGAQDLVNTVSIGEFLRKPGENVLFLPSGGGTQLVIPVPGFATETNPQLLPVSFQTLYSQSREKGLELAAAGLSRNGRDGLRVFYELGVFRLDDYETAFQDFLQESHTEVTRRPLALGSLSASLWSYKQGAYDFLELIFVLSDRAVRISFWTPEGQPSRVETLSTLLRAVRLQL